MSRYEEEKIVCPECHKKSDFRIWDSINTMINPEMKEQVRSGEAFLFTCPECGSRSKVIYPCLYHQMEDKMMIWLDPGDNIERTMEMLKGEYSNLNDILSEQELANYNKRVVQTSEDLSEKLLISDAGFDDRIVELQKLFLKAHLSESNPECKFDHMYFLTTEEGKHELYLFSEGNPIGGIVFDEEFYQHIGEGYIEYLEDENPILVDEVWATSFIQKMNGGKTEEE